MEVKMSLLQQAEIINEATDAKREQMLAAGKMANKIATTEIKKAGLSTSYPQKGATFKKAAISLSLSAKGGALFDHSVPLKNRHDGQTAPAYVAFTVYVLSSGETFRNSMDGPIDESKDYFHWSHEWKDEAPTEAELKAQIPAFRAAIEKALKKFDEVKKTLEKRDSK